MIGDGEANVAAKVKAFASDAQNTVFDMFAQIIPYAIGVWGLSWGVKTLKRNIGLNSARV